MNIRTATAALALLTLSTSAIGQVTCNSILTGNAALTADLSCTSGFTAIEIPTDDVTLDLNGFTLSGSILQAVFVSGNRVTIRGPGRIDGFDIGIQARDNGGLRIEDVEFSNQNQSIILNGTRNALVRRNSIANVPGIGIQVRGFDNGSTVLPSRRNRIVRNRIQDVGTGINVCGFNATEQQIVSNRLRRVIDFGIHLESGTNNNRVEDNRLVRMDNSGIRVANANNNRIINNQLDRGRLGITIHDNNGAFNPSCALPPVSGVVTGNLVADNLLSDYETGVVLGLGIVSLPRVISNRVGPNVFENNVTGLLLQDDAWVNDATGNVFLVTPTPVIDFGTANSY